MIVQELCNMPLDAFLANDDFWTKNEQNGSTTCVHAWLRPFLPFQTFQTFQTFHLTHSCDGCSSADR